MTKEEQRAKANAYQRLWRSRPENKEKVRKYLQEYHRKHRKEQSERNRQWRAKHREEERQRNRDRRKKFRDDAMAAYGNKCACCGETEPKFLSIDHMKGGGNKHRKELRRYGSRIYEWLKKNNYPPGFQVLCHNCNMAKGFYGVCPHQELCTNCFS